MNVHLSLLKHTSRIPAPLLNADDSERGRGNLLASTLGKTEVMDLMVLNFYQESCISKRRGQALLNMGHPEFNVEDVQSATIVQLLLPLERPFQKSVLVEYNLWEPGDRNQRLEL